MVFDVIPELFQPRAMNPLYRFIGVDARPMRIPPHSQGLSGIFPGMARLLNLTQCPDQFIQRRALIDIMHINVTEGHVPVDNEQGAF
jgi:hypothetical protein